LTVIKKVFLILLKLYFLLDDCFCASHIREIS